MPQERKLPRRALQAYRQKDKTRLWDTTQRIVPKDLQASHVIHSKLDGRSTPAATQMRDRHMPCAIDDMSGVSPYDRFMPVSYRERLRRNGQEALRRVQEFAPASKLLVGQRSDGQLLAGSPCSALDPAATAIHANSQGNLLCIQPAYPAVSGLDQKSGPPSAQDWYARCPTTDVVAFPMSPPASIFANAPYPPPQSCWLPHPDHFGNVDATFDCQGRTGLMAIAMPQAMDLAMNEEEIAAELRGAAPGLYED